jgi:hypothetical protein
MRSVARLNAGATLLVSLAITASMIIQLYTQAELRGLLPGVRVQRYTVTQKGIEQIPL